MYSLSSANSYLQSLVKQASEFKQEELNRLKQQSQPKAVKYSPTNRALLASLSKARQPLSTRKVLGSFNKASEKFSYNSFYDQLKNQVSNFNLASDSVQADKNISTTNISNLVGLKYTDNPQETFINYLKNKGYTVDFKKVNPYSSGGVNTLEVKDSSGKPVNLPISYATQWFQPNPTWTYDSKLDPNKEYEGLFQNFFANKEITKEYGSLNSEINKVQQSIQSRLSSLDLNSKNNLMGLADMKSIVYFKDKLESLTKIRDEWADKVNKKFNNYSFDWQGNRQNIQKPTGFEWDWFKNYQQQIKDTLKQYESEVGKTLDNSQKLLSLFESTKDKANKSIEDISNLGLLTNTKETESKKTTKEVGNYARQLALQRSQKLATITEEETNKKAAPIFRERPA